MQIKLLKKGIRIDGKYYPVWYSSSENNTNGNATISFKNYNIPPSGLAEAMQAEHNNETDSRSDYYDLSRFRVSPGSIYFNQVEEFARRVK